MKHFKLEEFKCQCGCTIPEEVKVNLTALVENVLDPARAKLNIPVMVNSGYRCPKHNKSVGGALNSQHCKGEAADITTRSSAGNLLAARLIEHHGRFDQMILYVEDITMNPRFLHIRHNPQGPNRHQILKKVIGKSGYQQIA